VATLVGYSGQSTFIVACKRWFGVTPKAYREGMLRRAAHREPLPTRGRGMPVTKSYCLPDRPYEREVRCAVFTADRKPVMQTMSAFRGPLVALFATFVMTAAAVPADACTRALYVSKDGTVIVGRSMDWGEDMMSNMWVPPRGMKRDGRDEVLTAVREDLRAGASQIKFMAGGGAASAYDPLDVTQYTLDELKAAVEARREVHRARTAAGRSDHAAARARRRLAQPAGAR